MSDNVAEGIIGFIKERPMKTGVMYSFVLNAPGASRDEKGEWYNTGFTKPPAEKGAAVKFAYTINDKGYKDADPKRFKVTAAAPPQSHNGGGAKKYAGGAGKDDYWAKKDIKDTQVTQPMIMFQNATTNAVNVVCSGFQTGTLDLGKTKAKQVPNLMILVRKVRDELFADYINKQNSLAAGEPPLADTEEEPKQLAEEAEPLAEEPTESAESWGDDDAEDWG